MIFKNCFRRQKNSINSFNDDYDHNTYQLSQNRKINPERLPTILSEPTSHLHNEENSVIDDNNNNNSNDSNDDIKGSDEKMDTSPVHTQNNDIVHKETMINNKNPLNTTKGPMEGRRTDLPSITNVAPCAPTLKKSTPDNDTVKAGPSHYNQQTNERTLNQSIKKSNKENNRKTNHRTMSDIKSKFHNGGSNSIDGNNNNNKKMAMSNPLSAITAAYSSSRLLSANVKRVNSESGKKPNSHPFFNSQQRNPSHSSVTSNVKLPVAAHENRTPICSDLVTIWKGPGATKPKTKTSSHQQYHHQYTHQTALKPDHTPMNKMMLHNEGHRYVAANARRGSGLIGPDVLNFK